MLTLFQKHAAWSSMQTGKPRELPHPVETMWSYHLPNKQPQHRTIRIHQLAGSHLRFTPHLRLRSESRYEKTIRHSLGFPNRPLSVITTPRLPNRVLDITTLHSLGFPRSVSVVDTHSRTRSSLATVSSHRSPYDHQRCDLPPRLSRSTLRHSLTLTYRIIAVRASRA